MSAREWKAGDVALAVRQDGTSCRAIRRHDGTWRLTESCDNPPESFRMLAVLDPENLGDLHDLMADYDEARERGEATMESLQWALRLRTEFPKMAEPKGLGALVRDREGDVLCRDASGKWLILDGGGSYISRWSDVKAIEVLSPGITPDEPEAEEALPPDLIESCGDHFVWVWRGAPDRPDDAFDGYDFYNKKRNSWVVAGRTAEWLTTNYGPMREVPHGEAVTS